MSTFSHSDELLSIYVTLNKFHFLQIIIGISANTFLFVFHLLTLFPGCRPKPTDLVICHLSLVHIIQLFAALFLFPELFETLSFHSNVKCKALFYLNRVMRNLSICTTCLLSVLQAATISPSTACIAHLKHKSTTSVFRYFFFLWIITLPLNSSTIFYTVAASNVTWTTSLKVTKYCSLSTMQSIFRNLAFAVTVPRDVFFVGMMLLSSAYIVLLLIRHHRRCQHLYRYSSSQRNSPEKRATQTILLLVSFIVVMYWVDFLVSSFSILLWTYDPFTLCFQNLVSHIYAAVSPLVFISSDKRLLNLLQNVCKIITLCKL